MRETAALALGLAGVVDAVPQLVAILTDSKTGRDLTRAVESIDFRTRSFAAYGLGLLAQHSESGAVHRAALNAARFVLGIDDPRLAVDVRVAALHTIRLAASAKAASPKLRDRARRFLGAYLRRTDVARVLPPHAMGALVSITPRGDRELTALLLDRLNAEPGRNDLRRTALIGLGRVATADDIDTGAAIREYAQSGASQQARYWATIALGRIGGEVNRQFLRARLKDKGPAASVRRPWVAFALALSSGTEAKTRAELAREVRASLATTRHPVRASGLLLALAILGDAKTTELARSKLRAWGRIDEAGRYAAISLGLLGAKDVTKELLKATVKARRRPVLNTGCVVGLGLLGGDLVSDWLVNSLTESQTIAMFAARARALGLCGTPRTAAHLIELLENEIKTPLSRAFAAVALGELSARPAAAAWRLRLASGLDYRACVETLCGPVGNGVLDLL